MTKKEGVFDKLKPEDVVFGDSLGEGKPNLNTFQSNFY